MNRGNMEKIIFADKHGQQIYNIHATLKVTFDVDAVVAQLLEDNRSTGDVEITLDDVIESVRGTIESIAYLAESNGSQVTLVERIIDNNWGVYETLSN